MRGIKYWWRSWRTPLAPAPEHHARLLRTLAAINPTLLGADSESQLFANVCRTLVEQGGFAMAWVGLSEAGSPRVRVACQTGFAHGYLENLDIRYDDSPTGRGPTGTAIRTGQTIINDDTESNVQFAPWRERARQHGYRSTAAIPLRVHQQVIGSLNVYAVNAYTFGNEEVVLLEKLAGDLGLAMERLRAMVRLKSSEHELAAILRNMQDTYYRTDTDGRIVRASESATRLLGYSPEEVLGLRLADFYVESDGREKFIAALQAAGGALQNYEARLRHRDGTVMWVSTNAHFVRDAEGKVIGIEGTVRNVTERHAAEEALGEMTALLEMSQALGHTGSWQWEVATGRVVWSAEMYRIYGVPDGQSVTLDLAASATHPEDRQRVEGITRAMLDGQPIDEFDFRIVRPDGSVRKLWSRAEVQRDSHGKPLQVVGVLQDITSRWQAEQALRDSEERYRTIVETAQEGIWTIDADGRTTFVNRKMADILGYTVDAMQGRSLFDFMDDAGRKIAMHGLERRKQGIAEQHEFRFHRQDGSDVWTELTTTPMLDPAGHFLGALAMVTDITERRRAGQALRESEALLVHSQQVAHVGSFDWNVITNEVKWSRETYRLFGENPDHPSTDIWSILARAVHPEDKPRLEESMARAREGIRIPMEMRVIWPDGTERTLWTEGEAVRGEGGQLLRMVGVMQDITERKLAERATRQSEEILNKAQEVAHIGSWWWDIVANHVICSRELLRLYGFPPDLTGTADEIFARIAQVIHPGDREQFQEAMQRLLATGQTGESIEYRVVLPDGQERTLLAYPEVVRSADGAPLYTYGALQDITDRKRAEQSLLEVARGVSVSSGESFFSALVEHLASALEADYAFVGALHPEATGKIRTVAVQALGRGVDNFEYDLVGTPCMNVIESGTCAYARDVQQLFPDDHMLADMGVQAYVGTPLRATDGAVLGLIVVLYRQPVARAATIASMLEIFAARAATELERRNAEAQMRKLSSAIEQTADSVMITDRNGVIEYVNPAFERNTGFVSGEALGQTPRLVRSGKQGQGFYQTLWQTILAGEVFSEVIINRRKDGTFYYEEKTITPLKDAQGRITHFISTGKDVTERMQTQEKLEFMAQHDALTELPNRALLLDRLKQSVARARWHQRLVAVLFVDLDRFKTINDTLGHEAGDQLLQRLGERFGRSVREGDTVARFGGDEFVILLDDVASDKDIGAVAQKVLDALKAPFEIDRQYLYITASIGISLFPNDGDDSSTLLKHADIAMYRAKELGKNTYQFYSADMSARAFERLSLENSLRHALERNEFVLHYQPQFDVSTGRIFGVEALLRWQHPDFGLVPPADFIALLEETGLIVPAGEWVLEEAGRQYRAWHESGYRNLRLAVNLSPRQVQSGALLATVQRVLVNGPEESGWLELEITEGLLVQQSAGLMEFFETLRTLGVRLAVDDFGTGYSSLAYLRRLPIDTLKIDRSFVRDVPGDADDSAITTTIIAMAQSLRLEVIAEGVENEAQRDFLGAHGCYRMQGYLFVRPQTATELSRLLAGGSSGSAPG